MRKLFLSIFVLTAVLTLSSCNTSSGPESGNLEFALVTNDLVYSMNQTVMDPAIVAFRLNCLLATAKEQFGNEYLTKLEQTKYTNANNLESNLIELFFNISSGGLGTSGNTLTDEGGGIFTLDLNVLSNSLVENRVRTTGKITIDTKNYTLLEDLTVGESWEISFPGDKYVVQDAYMWQYRVWKINSTFQQYRINKQNAGEWLVSGTSTINYYPATVTDGNWSFSFTVKTNDITTHSYERMIEGSYTVTGSSNGMPPHAAISSISYTGIDYEITSALKLKMSCGLNYRAEGFERIQLNGVPLESRYDPVSNPDGIDPIITVQYTGTSSTCSTGARLGNKGEYIQ